jgi:hypothetical protein
MFLENRDRIQQSATPNAKRMVLSFELHADIPPDADEITPRMCQLTLVTVTWRSPQLRTKSSAANGAVPAGRLVKKLDEDRVPPFESVANTTTSPPSPPPSISAELPDPQKVGQCWAGIVIRHGYHHQECLVLVVQAAIYPETPLVQPQSHLI